MSPLPGGRKHCVIAYGTRFPAVVRLPATSSYFNLVYFRHQQQEVKAKEQICITLVLLWTKSISTGLGPAYQALGLSHPKSSSKWTI